MNEKWSTKYNKKKKRKKEEECRVIAVHFTVESLWLRARENDNRYFIYTTRIPALRYMLEAMTIGLENISTRKCHGEEGEDSIHA